mmetsp:Transcript_1556/g.4539  ORF Transcript_1556/g.4539 Transcript_1556/m.4539 type:complete len:668 (-) Transcript_1556:261-2264(-)
MGCCGSSSASPADGKGDVDFDKAINTIAGGRPIRAHLNSPLSLTAGRSSISSSSSPSRGEGVDVESFRIAESDVQLGRKIGEGGAGDVFLATYAGRQCVAKRPRTEQAASVAAALSDVVTELKFAVQLRNPNIVEVYGAVFSSTNLLLVMEYCSNGSVRSALDSSHPSLTDGVRLRILEQAAHGLKYLNEDKGIVHRDVKAANVLLDGNFNAKITDFGISQQLSEIGAEEGFSGTVPFAAPELFVQDGKPSQKSDSYAFGCFMLEVLTAAHPWAGETDVQALAEKVVGGERPALPDSLHEVVKLMILWCWQGDADSRPDFSQLVELLTQLRTKMTEAGMIQDASAEGAGGGGMSAEAAAAVANLLKAVADSKGGDEVSRWAGAIQKRSHVRLTRTRAATVANTTTDTVGVVSHRDEEGNYVVNFPECDNVACSARDLYLDDKADRVRPGARVMLNPSVKEFKLGMGDAKHGMVGLVYVVSYDGKVQVNFGFSPLGSPSENQWVGLLHEVVPVGNSRGDWKGALQLGQAVRVPAKLEAPSTSWGKVGKGSVGLVRARFTLQSTVVYTVDFPEQDGWKGRAADLEVDRAANECRPGKRVRVRRTVTQPSKGWGNNGVSHASVGIVRSVGHDGAVKVAFPEDSTWVCVLADIEPAESCIVTLVTGGGVRC